MGRLIATSLTLFAFAVGPPVATASEEVIPLKKGKAQGYTQTILDKHFKSIWRNSLEDLDTLNCSRAVNRFKRKCVFAFYVPRYDKDYWGGGLIISKKPRGERIFYQSKGARRYEGRCLEVGNPVDSCIKKRYSFKGSISREAV